MTETIASMAQREDVGARHPNLREWIQTADELGLVRRLDNADWDLEIGALTEMVHLQSPNPVALLFDNIKGYPQGYRVFTNPFAHKELATRLLGLPSGLGNIGLTRAWREKASKMQLIPPREVSDGPLFENVLRGSDIDLWSFPTPRWHELDGGRYLGTACMVITRDPEDARVNVGCYRMMVHDRDKIGLYISPGKDGRIHRDKYFAKGEPMPVAAAFGMDPLLHVTASMNLSRTTNEYEWAGGVRGTPVDVIPGPVTGLPIPAHAEIALEGYVYPDRMLDEGPFGEWTGYYASDVRKEPYVQVEALYHRTNPIILGSPPTRPPSDNYYVRRTIQHALIWEALDAAGIPDVKGVLYIPASGAGFLVIAIRQRYAGHAKQAAHIAAQSRAGVYLGRYIVVVDDDVDIENPDEVLWAVWSRSDPEESLDLIKNCWSTPLDPRIPPERRERKNFGTSRLIIDATRPFPWRDQFPPVSMASRELQAAMRQKWGNDLFA